MSLLKVSRKVTEISPTVQLGQYDADGKCDSPPDVYCANVEHYIMETVFDQFEVLDQRPCCFLLLPVFPLSFKKVKFFLQRKTLTTQCSQMSPFWIFHSFVFHVVSGFLRCLPLCPRSIYYALSFSQQRYTLTRSSRPEQPSHNWPHNLLASRSDIEVEHCEQSVNVGQECQRVPSS